MPLLPKLACATLLAAVATAWAAVSRDDAAAIAQRASGGRVLAVEKFDAGNRPVWRVKVVTPAGDVRVILVDIETGRIS